MPTLLPFRDYDEKDVINIYAPSGVSSLNKGTLMKVTGPGLKLDSDNPIEMLGNAGDNTANISNVVLQRYGVVPKMTVCGAGEGSVAIGLTLFDVRETDENGEQLKFRPRKAAEMEVCLSGQAVPVVTRGIFAYSGVTGVSAGDKLYAGAAGALSKTVSGTAVATALGDTDANGATVIRLHC